MRILNRFSTVLISTALWVFIGAYSPSSFATNSGWWNFWGDTSSANTCVSTESGSQYWQWQAGQGQLTLNGDATDTGSSLVLTQALNQAGSAFWQTPFSLYSETANARSFSAAFSFRISNSAGISDRDGQGGDGLAFVINKSADGLGKKGAGLGYRGLHRSVAVEFDTFNNDWIDRNNGNHVGINLGGRSRSKHARHVDQSMNDGNIWYAWIDYRGDDRKLEVRLAQTADRPERPFMSKRVGIPWWTGGSQAYIGFSSGTGAASGIHEILSFDFVSTYAPIGECDSPKFTSEPVISTVATMQYAYQAQAQDATPADTLNYSLVTSPTGMTIDNVSGLINWLPSDQDVGEHIIELQVEDSIGLQDRQSFALTVLENMTCGVEGSHTVRYDNFDSLSAWQLNGKAADLSPNQNKVLRLTNSLSQSGSAFLTNSIPLTDQSGFKASFSASFAFKISDPVGISDADGKGADGLTFVVQTMANNVGGNGGGIGYEGIQRSLGIEFDTWNNGAADNHNGNHIGINTNGDINSLVLKPVEQRFNDGRQWYAWIDYDGNQQQLKISVSNGNARPTEPTLIQGNIDLSSILQYENAFIGFTSGTGAGGGTHDITNFAFTNTIAPIGDCGELAISSIPPTEITAGDTLNYQVEVTGAAANATITYNLVSGPAAASIDVNGLVQWLSTGTGNTVFTLNAETDTGDTAEQSFTLDVIQATNQAPVATSQSTSSGEDNTLSVVLTATDINDDALTYSIVQAPSNGLITGITPNLIYTPNPNFNGSDSFTFKANDGVLDSNTATINITVNAINDVPTAQGQSVSVLEDTLLAGQLVGSDVDGDAITYTLQQQANNGVVVVQPNGTYSYVPNINFNGSDSFNFIAHDGTINSSVAVVNIAVTAVNDQPIANAQSVNANEDSNVSVILTGSDIDSDGLTYQIILQPANGSLIGTAPNFTYQPNTDFNGTDSFTFRVNDGTTNSTDTTVSITVAAINDTPIADSQSVSTDEDANNAITLTASDIDGDALTYRIVTQPTNGTLTGAAPNITYQSDQNYNGTDSFTFLANDGTEDSVEATITISVNAVNDLPVADAVNLNTDEDTSAAVTLTASDLDGDSLIYQIVNQPTNGTLSGTAPNLTYQPNTDFNGADSFSFLVNDGSMDSLTATVAINVSAINDIPVANNISVTTNEDTNAAITLTGQDADGDALSYQVIVPPTNGVLTGTAPNLSYQPNADFNGSESLTYQVNDGSVDSVVASVQITVVAANDLPVALAQTVSTAEDTAVAIALTGNDKDGDILSYQIISQPAQGVLVGVAPALTYQPNAEYNGSDSFTFVVNDGTASSTPVTVDISVTAVNDAPVASDQSLVVAEDNNLGITLSASDIDGDSLSYSVLTQPANGVLNGTVPNLNYQPNVNFNGTDSFTFQANDGNDSSAVATINITVSAANDPPTADSLTLSTLEETSTTITLTGGDNDGDALTYQVVTQPISGSLIGTAPNLSYQPNADFNGADSFTYRVNDGTTDSIDATVQITVQPINDFPMANNQSLSINEDSSIAVTLTGSDVDGDTLSYNISGQPANGVLTGTAPDLTYIPNANFNGSDSFGFYTNDGVLNSNIAIVSITVTSVNDSPVASSQNVTTDQSIPVSILLVASDIDGDALAYSISQAPTNGTLIGTAPNLIYTPDNGFSGNDSFSFIASDGAIDSNIAVVDITVNRINRAPVFTSTPIVSIFENENYQYDISVSDPDNDSITLELVTAPSAMTFDVGTGSLSWTGTVTGSYLVTLRAIDSFGAQTEQNFTLNVITPVPVATTVGNDFWLMFNQNSVEVLPIQQLFIYVTATQQTIVNVEIPGLGYSENFTAQANQLLTVDLSHLNVTAPGSPDLKIGKVGVNANGIHVSASNDIRVYLMSDAPATTDGSLVLPTDVLGTEYHVASWGVSKSWFPGRVRSGFNIGSYFGLVATEDNTTITIEPSEPLNANTFDEQPANIAFNVTLNRGETYQGISDVYSDMTGNLITADKPIATFSGDSCASINAKGFCDHLVEQLMPSQSLGTEFLSMPLADRTGGDAIRFIGAFDNTYIWINGELTAFLNKGNFVEIILDQPAHIVASRPMTVAQFAQAGALDATKYDPFMVLLPALEQYVANHVVITVNDRMPVNYLNVIAPASILNSVRVDGVVVNASLWTNTGRTDYKGAQIPVSLGQHSVTADEPVMLISYGWGSWESYGYQGGMEISRQTSADSLSLSLNRVGQQVGDEVCVNAQLLTAANEPVTKTQVLFTWIQQGVQLPYADLTNEQGVAELCLTGEIDGTETIEALVQNAPQDLQSSININWLPAVVGNNRAPAIVSLPIMRAVPGEPFSDTVIARDADGDSLVYTLTQAPFGMTIDSNTGVINWQAFRNLEFEAVTVRVEDTAGNADIQSYNIRHTFRSHRYPDFTSQPITFDVTGRQYIYKVTAFDPDEPPVNLFGTANITIEDGPINMVLNENNWLVWDMKIADAGFHDIELKVTDAEGLFSIQTFTLEVQLNLPPVFTSVPVLQATVGQAYSYQTTVTDDNPGTLAVTVEEGPFGMSINAQGHVAWTSTASQTGSHNVVLEVTDASGVPTRQTYVLNVIPNQPPQFTQLPIGSAVSGHLYSYNILGKTSDPENNFVRFNYLSGPAGVSVNSFGYNWTPSAAEIGEHEFSIAINDGQGNTVGYDYTLIVTPNSPPVFTSTADSSTITAHSYRYVAAASDADGDAVNFGLVSGPSGMTSFSNVFIWTPTNAQVGEHAVVIRADDGAGGVALQSFNISVVANNTPVISSTPVYGVRVGAFYQYDVQASDIDGDTLTYSLLTAPTGMIIIQDRIRWSANNSQAGIHPIVIQVSDGVGGIATQSYNVTVVAGNIAFTHLPNNPSAPHDKLYQFQLEALHPSATPPALVFSLTSGPAGLGVSNSGLLQWTPIATQIGTHSVSVNVTDNIDQQISATFNIDVIENNNLAPVINSTPALQAQVQRFYNYTINATDPEGSNLTYSLPQAPASMNINTNTGFISWEPTMAEIGVHAITIRVTDSGDEFSEQSYNLTVKSANQPPVVNSIPATNAAVGILYQFVIGATDPDGDSLVYTAINVPNGLVVDSSTGIVNWTPSATQVGGHTPQVAISDGIVTILASWNIQVSANPLPINIVANINPRFIQQGETTQLTVVIEGGVREPTINVTVDGVAVILDTLRQITLNGDTIGRHDIVITATDTNSSDTQNLYYAVADPTDTTAPVVSIAAPLSGARITAPTDIIGSVSDNNLVEVLLAFRQAGDEEFITLFQGSNPLDNANIAQFDPTLLRNGLYQILLQGTDANGQTTGIAVPVIVEGNMKIGVFSITLEDLSIPLSGIPIRVTRTYDSRRRNEALDFGQGWSIDYQNVSVEESMEPTENWRTETLIRQFKINGGSVSFQSQCTRDDFGKTVTITLPNDDVEVFTVHAAPSNNSLASESDPDCHLVADRFFDLEFRADQDTESTLSSVNGQSLFLTNHEGGNLSFAGQVDPRLITQYLLTTREGFVYNLNQNFGIVDVTDPNGNKLTYSDTGIQHSDGSGVTFNRDADGRISSITDPAGNQRQYEYNSNGNLLAMQDPLGNRNTYQYNNGQYPNLLTDWFDALGRNIITNIYDSDGRLVAQQDNLGNRSDFNHDLPGRLSTITNRRGFITQYRYDERGNVISQTDALGNLSSQTYDSNDNQLSQTNELGNTSFATYNTADDQLTQTDELGNVVTFTYNQRGQELTITDALNNPFVNTYDSVGNLLSISDPLSNSASNVLNYKGQVVSTTDTLGNVTTFTYDNLGNKLTETNAEGHVTTYTYDNNNNVLSEAMTRTLADNSIVTETTQFEYDSLDRLLRSINAQGNASSNVYDLVGNEIVNVDTLGRRTVREYDAFGRVTRLINPDGGIQTKTYDAEGNLLTERSERGRTTSFEYDALDRLIRTTYSGGISDTTEYDAASRVIAEIDTKGNRTTYEYDIAGRRTATIDALGNRHSFEYDAEGQLIRETDANGQSTQYQYNALDQRIRTTFDNASTLLETYDALGRRTSSTDQAGRVTRYEYDGLSRLIKVIDAQNNETTYSYDEASNKRSQTDAELRTTQWEYDALGRVTARVLPLGQRNRMTYDKAGNPLTETDFNGQTIVNTYDAMNRLQTQTDVEGIIDTYRYFANGFLETLTRFENETNFITRYGYDQRNRLSRKTLPDGTSHLYQYDRNGNRTSLSTSRIGLPGTGALYSYDDLNRLQSVNGIGGITSYTYDAVGNRASISYPNGNQTTYSYDSLNRLTDLTTADSNNNVIQSYSYSLDPTGRRTQIVENNGRTTDYQYDTLYRLIDEQITDNLNGNHNSAYQYDKVGNRTQSIINGVTTQYQYDNNDRLQQQGGTTYSYDNNGSILTESGDSGLAQYSYNSRNQLISLNQAPGTSTNYRYDYEGNRTQVIDNINITTTDYIVDTNQEYAQVVVELTDSNISKQYIYGDDLISQKQNNINHYYHYDGLGSTRALTNNTGTITDSYHYDAFGIELSRTGTTDNDYLFTGEQYDQDLEQYYLRARYYDPNSARFTQMDEWMGRMKEPVTLHKYLYTNSDPVNYIDPTGNFGLASFGAASNIRATLTTTSVPNFAGAVTRAIGATLQVTGRATVQSLRVLRKCIRKKNRCGLQFNLLIVGYDNPVIRDHIKDAQGPRTVVLTYQKNKPGNRQWYRRKPECRVPKAGYQCDEYPMFKTTKGGERNYLSGIVSLRQVPGRENASVGGHFGFLAKNMNKSKVKDFVVITSDSLPTVALPLGKGKK